MMWQQLGFEAFDAMLKWLEKMEADGDFKISDRKLRKEFYQYWSNPGNLTHVTDASKRIEESLLEPEWIVPKEG